MKRIATFLMGMLCILSVAKAQDITVFNFDGTTPVFSTWSSTCVSVANPVPDGVNASANVGMYTHMWKYSEINIDLTATPINPRVYTSFQFKVYSPAAGRLIVGCRNATDASLSEYNSVQSVTAGWTTITQNIDATTPITKIYFSFKVDTDPVGGSADVIYLDDLKFIKSTNPFISLYSENFEADLAWDASPTVTPSTKAGKWKGGIDLQTAGDAPMNLDQWWGDHSRVLKLTSTDAAVTIPNINVAGFENLKLSIDFTNDNVATAPIIEASVDGGAFSPLTTAVDGAWNNWGTQVITLPAATSTISLRINPNASNSVIFDNFKVLGNIHYEFTGGTSTDPTVSTNWLGGFIQGSTDDVTISGGNLVLDQNTTYHSITVNPTAKLTLNDTKSLTASSLLLKSDATGTATFVDNNATPAAISATVQQYLPATDRNWYVSSPITSATNGNLSTGASVVEYNEATGAWPTVSGALNPMKGYISTAGSAGTGTLSFTGNVNSGSQSITLSSQGSTYTGFNLVGNPYPSYLSWTEALANSANCLPTIWYRTKSGSVYSFQTYNAQSGISVPTGITGYIPPMQAFWVKTSVNGSMLTVNNTNRSHGDGSSNLLKAPSAKNVVNPLVRLQVSNGANSDETVIYCNANADNGFDSFDSPKMFANNVNVPEIFTTSGTEQLVINGLKTLAENVEIPLGFRTGTSNDFTLAATELKNLENGMHVVLKDNLLQSETDLSEGATYNFSSDVTTANTGRFSLIFKVAGSVTSVSKTNPLNAQVFVNVNKQIVIVASEGSNYSIYNSVGQKISEGFTTSNRTIVSGQRAGIYVVRLSEGGKNQSSKVIIK